MSHERSWRGAYASTICDGFQATLRALAYKWIRILWRCWKDHVRYGESQYLAKLRTKTSPLLKYLPPSLDSKAA